MAHAKANAVAGVGARNGVKQIGTHKGIGAGDRAIQPTLTVVLTALLDAQGMVTGITADRVVARAFLRGGCA